MPVSLPTPDQMKAIAAEMGLSLTETDIDSFLALMKPSIEGYNVVDSLPDNLPAGEVPAHAGLPPAARGEHAQRLVLQDTDQGRAAGKLKGKTIVLKDNVMVAGVPMMNGASTLEGYTPEVDATIVTRILDAGGTILGKAHCEYYCLSGRQPHQRHRAGAQPVQDGLLGRRLVVGQRGAGRPAARPTWRSAAIRAARSACRPRSAASTA